MIYMDNAATTCPEEGALDFARQYLSEKYYNPSAMYKEGFALRGALKEARLVLLSTLADEDYDVVFTSCGSEADNQAIFGYGRRGNVVTTAGEHSAVAAAVAELKNRGVEPRFAPLLSDGRADADALLRLVDDKTSLVSVIHVNNETGAINDVNALARSVKQKNSRVVFHSDGVQAYGKLPFRLGKEIDLYSVSAHKIGALKGTGALFRKKSLPLRPFIFGGGQESGWRSGTENVFGIKVFEGAANLRFPALGMQYARLASCKKRLLSLLDKEIFVAVSQTDENLSSPYLLAVSAVGLRGEVLLHMADDRGLIVGTGSACSSNAKNRYSRVILACGKGERIADGMIRLSFSPHTTETEIEKAADILNVAARELKSKTA